MLLISSLEAGDEVNDAGYLREIIFSFIVPYICTYTLILYALLRSR